MEKIMKAKKKKSNGNNISASVHAEVVEEKEELEEQVTSLEEQNEAFEEQVTSLEEQNEELVEKIKDFEAALSDVKPNDNPSTKEKKLSTENTKMKTTLKSLREEVKSLKEKPKDLTACSPEVHQAISELCIENISLKRQLEEA
jgi:phage shock protein A